MSDARAFRRIDESPDARFYAQPRFVQHIDDFAVGAVTQLYREQLPAGGRVLDLMSSWVSHLPPEVAYSDVIGVGMNAAELARNPRLKAWHVQDLNVEPALPFDDAYFDAVTICVSIQYLTRPREVLTEVARVLRPRSVLIITFSNRCFPTKAVAAWQARDSQGHLALVTSYLRAAGGWDNIVTLDRSPLLGDRVYAVVARAAQVDRAS